MNEQLKKNSRVVSEDTLVERCRRGDRDAQRGLFKQTSEPIYRLLLRMTRNQDDAFDLSQETYLKAFGQIETFDGRSAIATWLYKIAVNEALQFLRRNKTKREKLEKTAFDQNDNENLIEAVAIKLDMRTALAKVDPSDRVMLLLRYENGLDYRAIAEVIGCAEGTVASRLSRSRERLREILRESYELREEDGAGVHPKN